MLEGTNIRDKVSRQVSRFTPTLPGCKTAEMEIKLQHCGLPHASVILDSWCGVFYNLSNQKKRLKVKVNGLEKEQKQEVFTPAGPERR